MTWLHFVAAAVAGGAIMSLAGAPFESVLAGVTIAGGVSCIRQLLGRSK